MTLLLSISTAGLIVPHERLKPGAGTPHPSRDRNRHRAAARQYEGLLRAPFLSSRLWMDGPVSSWRKGRIRDVRSGSPETWEELRSAGPLGSDVRVNYIESLKGLNPDGTMVSGESEVA